MFAFMFKNMLIPSRWSEKVQDPGGEEAVVPGLQLYISMSLACHGPFL